MRKYKPNGRRRGAPLGNTNNLKHGIYSRYISATEENDLQNMVTDKTHDELALARVRLQTCIKNQLDCPPERWPEYERLVTHYLRIIVSLIHKNHVIDRPPVEPSRRLTDAIKRYREQTGLLAGPRNGDDSFAESDGGEQAPQV